MSRTTRVTGITISVAIVSAIAACGPRSATQPVRDHVAPPPVDAAVASVPPDAAPPITMITPTRPQARIDSPHGGMITDLAVTPDGTAAVTSDDLGGHRLWPSLDGQHEPRVIELPSPSQIAIGHDPKGFLIALIDDAGGLVLQQVDRDGLMIQRSSLPLEPIYRGVAMTDRGPIAWRSDQRLVRLAADGTFTAQLATEPGHRLLSVAVPATKTIDRGIAIIEGSSDNVNWRRVRFVALGEKLAWGPWLSVGDDVEPNAAVSPSLSRFAFIKHTTGTQGARAQVYEVATSKLLGTETTFNAAQLELPDDDHLVWAGPTGQVNWLEYGQSTKRNRPILVTQLSSGTLASGGGKVFNPNGGEIVISTKTTASYLGYALQGPAIATAGKSGQLAIATGERVALLDDKLRAQSVPMVPTGHSISLLRWLTGDEWAVQAVKLDTGTTILSLVDLAKSVRTEWRTNQVASQLTYEPASKLLAVSYGQQPEVARYVPGKLRVEPIAAWPKSQPYDRVQIWPVSPAVSGGIQAVTSVARDSVTVRWLPDARVLDKGTALTYEGSVAAVDVTGRVYAWRNDGRGKLALVQLREGKQVGEIAVETGGRGVFPDPTGERLIITGPQTTMYRADGTRMWSRAQLGVTHVIWLDDGAVALVSSIGIARLDGKTGEVLAKKCGWVFELASKPHPARTRIEPMCTQR